MFLRKWFVWGEFLIRGGFFSIISDLTLLEGCLISAIDTAECRVEESEIKSDRIVKDGLGKGIFCFCIF